MVEFAAHPCGPEADATLGCFRRVAGDDWRESKALLFQWGRLVPAVTNPDGSVTPASVVGYDITGCRPLGRLLANPRVPPPPFRGEPPSTLYQWGPDLTPDNGYATIVDAANGLFAFTPDRTITADLPTLPVDASPREARLHISAKLITAAGSLNTIRSCAIVVLAG